jgi:hypothetical protein
MAHCVISLIVATGLLLGQRGHSLGCNAIGSVHGLAVIGSLGIARRVRIAEDVDGIARRKFAARLGAWSRR